MPATLAKPTEDAPEPAPEDLAPVHPEPAPVPRQPWRVIAEQLMAITEGATQAVTVLHRIQRTDEPHLRHVHALTLRAHLVAAKAGINAALAAVDDLVPRPESPAPPAAE